MMRSVLYVPASRPGMLEKLSTLDADFLILDLEDGVAQEDKSIARDHLSNVADAGLLPQHPDWALRVNHPGSAEHDTNLQVARRILGR